MDNIDKVLDSESLYDYGRVDKDAEVIIVTIGNEWFSIPIEEAKKIKLVRVSNK